MKKQLSLALIALMSITVLCAQTKVFKGAWFDIKYPATFTARPSLPVGSAANACESAFFLSPDRLVEFYVFSPQWSGEPSDIALKGTETLASTRTESSGTSISTWWTITDKAGAYTRSYHEKRDTMSNTNLVFGVKYKDITAYNKYKEQYVAFKASLVQYAD
jgi:hypothetical protein